MPCAATLRAAPVIRSGISLSLPSMACASFLRRGLASTSNADFLQKDASRKLLETTSTNFIRKYRAADPQALPPAVQATEINQACPARHFKQHAAAPETCARLAHLLQHSDLQHLFSSNGERKVAVSFGTLPSILGNDIVGIVDVLKMQMHEQVAEVLQRTAADFTETGCIISWLSPLTPAPKQRSWLRSLLGKWGGEDTAEKGPKYEYTTLHCDKANNFEYDITALLYLSDHGTDFTGGELIFVDQPPSPTQATTPSQHNKQQHSTKTFTAQEEDLSSGANSLVQTAIRPKRGSLVVFDSGIGNFHRVSPVVSGNRLLLSVWYGWTRG